MFSGRISDKIVYIHGYKCKYTFEWEDGFSSGDERLVIPAFCTEADNQKSIEKGIHWAKGGYWNIIDKYDPVVEERDNKPIEIEIVGIDYRSQGGIAWKVISDGFYFDLRCDVLLDTIKVSRITKGKILDKFIWAKIGSQMKLVRENSLLHHKLIESTNRKSLRNISAHEYEIGQCYSTRGGKKYVYLGDHESIKYGKKVKGHMWLSFSTIEPTLHEHLKECSGSFWWGLHFIKKPSIVEKIPIKWDVDWNLIKQGIKKNKDYPKHFEVIKNLKGI